MATCNLLFGTQIASIIAAIFGIVVSIIELATYHIDFTSCIVIIYVLIFCLLLLLVEIYIPNFLRFFGFLLKNWGKALTYLFVGFLFFNPHRTFNIIVGVVFWVLAIIYLILTFITKGIAKPLAQRNSTITLSTTNGDYWVEA